MATSGYFIKWKTAVGRKANGDTAYAHSDTIITSSTDPNVLSPYLEELRKKTAKHYKVPIGNVAIDALNRV